MEILSKEQKRLIKGGLRDRFLIALILTSVFLSTFTVANIKKTSRGIAPEIANVQTQLNENVTDRFDFEASVCYNKLEEKADREIYSLLAGSVFDETLPDNKTETSVVEEKTTTVSENTTNKNYKEDVTEQYKGTSSVSRMRCRITAYIPDAKWAYSTSTGTTSKHLQTCAVDPDVIPLGSTVIVYGNNNQTLKLLACDIGNGVKGKQVDVFFDGNKSEAYNYIENFGEYQEVEVYPEGSDSTVASSNNSTISEKETYNNLEATQIYKYGFDGVYIDADEADYIARIVMAETGGADYTNSLAVAQCYRNAMKKENLDAYSIQKKYGYAKPKSYANQACKNAVSEVFYDGKTVTDEPILYFYEPSLVSSEWHESQIYVMSAGGHRFFKERT